MVHLGENIPSIMFRISSDLMPQRIWQCVPLWYALIFSILRNPENFLGEQRGTSTGRIPDSELRMI